MLFVVEENPVFLKIERTHTIGDAEGRISKSCFQWDSLKQLGEKESYPNYNPSVLNLLVQDTSVLPSDAPRRQLRRTNCEQNKYDQVKSSHRKCCAKFVVFKQNPPSSIVSRSQCVY